MRRCRVCNGVRPTPETQTMVAETVGITICDCEQNPKFWRSFRVSVQVSREWLTNGGEGEEAEGWTEIENELRASLLSRGLATEIKLEFEEWDVEPEEIEFVKWSSGTGGVPPRAPPLGNDQEERLHHHLLIRALRDSQSRGTELG